MNFKITHDWLLDYLDTDTTAEKIQSYLSLSAVNVETLEKVKNDSVYDIEVTSNRIDAASVFGFALECAAVLPRNGEKAKLISHPLDKTFAHISKPSGDLKKISIQIKDVDTVSRIAALVLTDVKVGPSPDHIRDRLEACGERSINNVVDISNYLRIALGQPVHMFDYDAIEGASMTIEKSKPGDIVTLIDGTDLKLPGNDVIIKDGSGRIIDLVGLMGGQNTEVKESTQNVLFFVPIVNRTLVRKTSMNTGHRTAAISYFEKGLDEERVEPALVYGVELLQEFAGATVASEIFDSYPEPQKEVIIDVNHDYVQKLINAVISADEIAKMIAPLGFSIQAEGETLHVSVPSYRRKDVDSQADIAEEIARMYGYHNITPQIQMTNPVFQPLEVHHQIAAEESIRDFLSACGFYEQYNYSMISKADIEKTGQPEEDFLKLSNTISTDIEYLRNNLVPSLLKNITNNQGKAAQLHFFEIARVYRKRVGDLPEEISTLGIATTANLSILKGVIENLLELLKCEGLHFAAGDKDSRISLQTLLVDENGDECGRLGVLSEATRLAYDIRQPVSVAQVRMDMLIKHINYYPKYVKPNPHAHIKLDYTYTSSPEHMFADIQSKAYATSSLLQSIDLVSQFENNVTLRFVFAAADRNITDVEAQAELEKIKAVI